MEKKILRSEVHVIDKIFSSQLCYTSYLTKIFILVYSSTI
jgi:hypothetical protein